MSTGRLSLLAILLTAVVLVPPAHAAGDNLFTGVQVHTINIEFSQPAWWDSLVIYYNEGLERYIPATVTADGAVFDSVGIRLKGNASYTHPNDKKPFRLSFDEYIDSQRWDGLKGIHLNNCWEDPTFIREKLHLDFARAAGIPAPRGAFAELYLNGQLWGFYSMVEHVDKIFLTSRYGDNGGNLYKAVDGLLGGPISDFKWYGSDLANYYSHYEFKTDDSPNPWTDLVGVIDSLNNQPDVSVSLPPVVNMNSVYRAFATDLLMSSLDSYAGSGRNFYVYFNPTTGKMEWTLWDVGMSMGSYWGSSQNYETLSITYVSNTTNRPLAAKIFNNATLKNEYLYQFCRIFNEFFSEDQLYPQIDAIANVIRPYVYADPRKMYTNEQFETNIVSDITVGGHRKPGLKSFIAARKTNVASQLAAYGMTCPTTIDPGSVVINEFEADNTQILDPAGEAEDWIEMYNNSETPQSLFGLHMTDDPATPMKWQFPAGTTIPGHGFLIVWADDDAGQAGLHANFKLSAAGEQVWFTDTAGAVIDSVSFGLQTTDLSMARVPNGTGDFFQGPPTFNAINGLVTGAVVINEFAADNTQIHDPAGDAEDWIEMYNNTSGPVDLSGMYLSDTPTAPTKWQFPAGTTIEGHGFLIIWADNELTEQGLHASWKLSASGESVVFSNAQAQLLDSVTFGQQTTNLTMARVPNGTGDWVQGPPTFNRTNDVFETVGYHELVLNEFMASNDSIADPAGEYEDWVEIYNNTSRTIHLDGHYLSDDYAAPTKWQFPTGTTIPTDGYLIVWADEDLTQDGLHAGFKLSAGGERLILTNNDLSVVDSTAFGAQTLNKSMARIPNGTGTFIQTRLVTPGASNLGPAGVDTPIERFHVGLAQNAPNPFGRSTVFQFGLKQASMVRLELFDAQGRQVATIADEMMSAGMHRIAFDGHGLASGVYLARLRTDDGTEARRVAIMK